MVTLGIIAALLSLIIVCSTLLLHQHSASKREEKRLALLDKGLDMVGTYLYQRTGTPYPANLLPEESAYLEEDESEQSKLIGSGSGSKNGSGSESGRGTFNGSGSEQQKKLNTVYQFYTRYPDASLADGVRSLGIADATLSRLHAKLVQAGNLEPFPKNR